MLYEVWRGTVGRYRDDVAVRDLAGGGVWTFKELEAAAWRVGESGGIRFPQGAGVEFLLSTISGWREGRMTCPLEVGQRVAVSGELPRDWVHLKTTSATTGEARVVGFTAEQLAADVENIVATMGLRRDWPNLGVISLAHSYGFSSLVLPLLLRGIPLLLGGSPLPAVVRHAAEVYGPVTLPAVPALWRAWQQAGVLTRQIRLAISAGAPLPVALEREVFEVAGLKLHNFYGASECGGIAYDANEEPRREETLAGRPMRNVEVACEVSGCLSVKSGAVADGYWPKEPGGLADGRFVTGDLAELRDGEVHLLGRASDVINVAGRKIPPETIEQAVLEAPGVEGCLVFGVPSADRGEVVVALLVVRGKAEVATLRSHASRRLPSWQVPRVWCVTEELGVNARGKLSRAEWRRRYLAGDGAIREVG
jgi:acyl-CoA synthetase (AMP-forming)/AMP-acid ligase II